ncbi:MAG: gliding motility-associated C-terminal domain-containing protein [Flavobacteriales bacterium]
MRASFIYFLLIVLLAPCTGFAQGCAEALENHLCAEATAPSDTLESQPFVSSCMNVLYSSYYSFQTNNIADVSTVTVDVDIIDCDYTTEGDNDSVYVMIIPLLVSEDPCSPSLLSQGYCTGDSISFSFNLAALVSNTDYLVVVGTNHSPNYGPCEYRIGISGSAVDLAASVAPLEVSLGESAQLHVDGADEGGAINWEPSQYLDDPTSTDPTVFADETTVFQVTGYVGDCRLTDVVSLAIGPPISIYNTFTPNGDGINDSWRIRQIERFENCQIEVFDRWGQSIFKSIGYAQPWDGTFKGRPIPTGPYYYVIELNSLDVTIPPIMGVVSVVH